jgi:hypothetical protein
LVKARVRINVLVPLLVLLIGAEITFGLAGMAAAGTERHGSGAPTPAVLTRTTTPAKFAQITRIEATRRQPVKRSSAPARPSAPAHNAPVAARNAPSAAPTAAAVATGWGCGDALAWLSSHAAPGYQFECPGYAEGHQAMTCINSEACPGSKLIVIADPCPAAYMNEAHNSWVVSGLAVGTIDPYGSCN